MKPDEESALIEMLVNAFWGSREDNERWMEEVGKENYRTVHVGGRLAGGLTIIPMGQWFGGQVVLMGGIAGVAIAPEFRGRGAASALMRSALHDMREAGMPISSLFPSAPPVYRKAGYEFGGSRLMYRADLNGMPTQSGIDIEPIKPDDFDAVKETYNRRAKICSGHLDRHPAWWKDILEPSKGKAPGQYMIRRDGRIEGYVCSTQGRDREGRRTIQTTDMVGLTAEARLGILSFLGGHRSTIPNAQWHGGFPDPFADLIPNPPTQIWAGLWMLRVVDVASALEKRGYPKDLNAELHLQIEDDWLDWNNGKFVLAISNGEGAVSSGGKARLKLDVRTLAGLYTGRLAAADLKLNGAIDAQDSDIEIAGQAFAGPYPWMPDGF